LRSSFWSEDIRRRIGRNLFVSALIHEIRPAARTFLRAA